MGNVETVRSMAATRLVKIEAEDTGVAVMRFNSGALGVLEATTATRPKDLEGSISILGEKGSVVIGGFFMNELVTWNFEDKQPIDDVVFEQVRQEPAARSATTSASTCAASSRRSRRKKAALVDGLEGRKSLELITALYESIETNTRRAAALPAEEVPSGDGVMTTYKIYANVALGDGSLVEDFCIVGAPPRGARGRRAAPRRSARMP